MNERRLAAGNGQPALTASLTETEFAGRLRDLAGWQVVLVRSLAIGLVLFHILVLNLYPVDPWLLRTIHVTGAAVLIFALYDADRSGPADQPDSLVGLAAHGAGDRVRGLCRD